MDPQRIITFAKLRKIEIEGCSSLKSVFPTSVAKALMQLEELDINDCATVEEIVAKEEGIEIATSFEFPRLIALKLKSLPELKSFYPGKHTSDWQLLNRLTIYKCGKLKIFGSNKESVEETNGLGHDVGVIQDLFFFSVKAEQYSKGSEVEEQQQQQSGSNLRRSRTTAAVMKIGGVDEVKERKSEVRVKIREF
ncbi:hypothetical protein SO802_012930 [Lithocarpus litseifolius]|uniref:Disease resistance protein At4g27190-like leucine-rich repeats domain-containing protein n=1 Tax=Lithocarpus litseifolius TaxID=425828 RepID=A0AAW2D4Z4_9ROSI